MSQPGPRHSDPSVRCAVSSAVCSRPHNEWTAGRKALRAGDQQRFVDCIGEEGAQTASKLEQFHVSVPLDSLIPAMWNILAEQATQPNHKVIVFFVTARCTQFFAEFFAAGGFPVFDIHSRKCVLPGTTHVHHPCASPVPPAPPCALHQARKEAARKTYGRCCLGHGSGGGGDAAPRGRRRHRVVAAEAEEAAALEGSRRAALRARATKETGMQADQKGVIISLIGIRAHLTLVCPQVAERADEDVEPVQGGDPRHPLLVRRLGPRAGLPGCDLRPAGDVPTAAYSYNLRMAPHCNCKLTCWSGLLQVGAASSKEQYVHRTGRSARAGKSGVGLLLLCDFERFFLRELKGITVNPWKGASISQSVAPGLQTAMDWTRRQKGAEEQNRGAQAYQAWLGYYNGFQRKCGWTPAELVATANQFSACIGLEVSRALRFPLCFHCRSPSLETMPFIAVCPFNLAKTVLFVAARLSG